MTLPEQCAVLLEVIEYRLLQPEDIIRWVDNVVMAMDKPPAWAIELYELGASYVENYVSALERHSSGILSVHRRVQIILLAYPVCGPLLHETLAKLFQILIFEQSGIEITMPLPSIISERSGRGIPPLDALDERLVEALIYWDCEENLEVIGQALQDKFTHIFREYLCDANEVASVLPWKFKNRL